ncbi:hypothetical protein CNR22_02965 [Sphingobacteriaceae bacterium]|nr:hypothetical protein CNR22_02965 [Sphingobacteriaceae bacterium]
MMEGLQISIPQRMMLVRITLIISLICSVLLSFNLWGGYRSVPYTSLIGQNPLKAPYDCGVIILVIFLWTASLFLNRQRLIIFFSFLICVMLVLFDINRLQPWFYVYNALLLVFVFYNGRVDDSNKFTSYFIILQIILASVYFFCGLHQLNSLFIDSDFTDIISPLKSIVSERQFLFFKKMGVMVPYILMFIGLGLIISPVRYLAITLAILVHVALLIFLFPSSKNLNYALWFGNLSFLIMLMLLFSGKTKQKYFSPTFLFQIPIFYPTMILFVVMPLLNNSGKWPDYLSSNFKSGNNRCAKISLSEKAAENLPTSITRFCATDYSFLNFDYRAWCLHDLNVECYPDETVFNSIYNYVKQSDRQLVKEIELQLLPRQKLLLKP